MGDNETDQESQGGDPMKEFEDDDKFLKVLKEFKPNGNFERNLVKGLIVRNVNTQTK